MLLAASQPIHDDDDHGTVTISVGQREKTVTARPHVETTVQGGRYRSGSRASIPTIAAILVAHALVIGALVQVRHHVRQVRHQDLTVVNLAPPPSPPPAASPETAPSPEPQAAAPAPVVPTPLPVIRPVAVSPTAAPATPAVPVQMQAPPAPTAAPIAPPAPPAPPAIVQGGDLGTQMLSGKPPRYPVESRRKREQGTVVLSLTLGLDGAVETINVSQSSGFARLDDAARDAVKGWRWKPTVRGGQPVRVRGVVEIPFVIQGRG